MPTVPDCPPAAKPLFLAAIRLPQADRPAFLAAHCGDNPNLRRWVEGLLAAHVEAGDSVPLVADETADFRPAAAGPVVGPEPGTVVGPYILREPLGEGGMGLVYVAEQTTPVRRKVALKVIKPGMDTRQVVARFEAERQALALMDHPNIARVLDAGATPDGRPYFVMELVKGEPVTAYCDASRLTVRQRIDLFLQVCTAVQHAHQKGVIHRDLKPSNVLVAVHDVAPVVKVIDFGIAKAVGQSLTDKTVYTGVAQLVGTPLYMSPEQAGRSSLDVDTRSDVYSLGVLLYELLTGTTPIDPAALRGAGYDELQRVIREDEPARPSTRLSTLHAAARSTIADRRAADPGRLVRQVRGELDWVVMRCLEKDRNRRYETVGALADDVRRFLADEPVHARPASVVYRLRKFGRRNRARVAVAATAIGLALVVSAGAGWLYLSRTAERDRVVAETRVALAGGKAAVEAGDLNQAGVRVAEARVLLGPDPTRFDSLAAEVERLGAEVAERQSAADRFRQFLKQAQEAVSAAHLDKLTHESRVARAEAALGLYGVVTEEDWQTHLERAHLTTAQRREVREAAYVTLLFLADYKVRWMGGDPSAVRDSLDLLRRAEVFHPPTRAFYFIRGKCHERQKDATAAAADSEQARRTPAETAWDHFFPGHSAGWAGDTDGAIRAYRDALRHQPDHYPSMYFLAVRLASKREYQEAAGVYTGVIALRPDDVEVYCERAACLLELGRWAQAEADCTTALARVATDEFRASAHKLRAKSYERSGQEGKARDDWARAVACYESTVKEQTSRLGSDDPGTLLTLNNYAVVLGEVGRHADALRVLEPLLEKSTAVRGPNHPETVTVICNLVRAYGGVERHADAIRVLEPVVERLTGARGRNHEDTLFLMCFLGNAYKGAGRYADAVRTLEPVLAACEAKNGPNDPLTLWALDSLAAAHDQGGSPAEAIRLYEPLTVRAKAVQGEDHPDTLRAMNDLGVAYVAAGRPGDAVRVLARASERWKATAGPDHAGALTTMYNLASAYGDSGEWESAERLWKDLVERHRRHDGPKSVTVAAALAGYGQGLLKRRLYVEAEPVLRECLALREKLMPDRWLRFNTMSLLGGALFGQKKYADAEPLLLAGYEGMNKREATIPPHARVRLTEAVERLAALYEATDRTAEAKRLRAKHEIPVAPPPRPVSRG